MTANRVEIGQAVREFRAAWARADENTDPAATRQLADEVARTAQRLVELDDGIVGGTGQVGLAQARDELRADLPVAPGPANRAEITRRAAEGHRITLQLAELEAGNELGLAEPGEEIEP